MSDKMTATMVPRTIIRGVDTVTVAATIVLRPATIGDSAYDIPLFEQWPDAIHAILTKGHFRAELSGIDAVARPAGEPIVSLALKVTSLGGGPSPMGLRPAGVDVAKLWISLLQDDDSDVDKPKMTGLRAALFDATATGGDHPFDDVKQADPKVAGAPDIQAVPRAELAQQITMTRAMIFAGRINAAVNAPPPVRTAYLGEGGYFRRPWARSPTPTERLALDRMAQERWLFRLAGVAPDGTPVEQAAAAAPPLPYDPFRYDESWADTKRMNWTCLKDILQRERKRNDLALETLLVDERAKAADIHTAEGQLSSDDKDKRAAALLTIAKARATHRTLRQSIGEVRAAGDIAHDLLGRHVAATAEDHGSKPRPDSHTRHNGSTEGGDKTADRARVDDARRRWFALMGLPALQRLFFLSVDVEITFALADFATLPLKTIDDLVGGRKSDLAGYGKKEKVAFLLLRLRFDHAAPFVYAGAWTLAKTPNDPPAGEAARFVPATLEEVLVSCGDAPASTKDLRECGTVDQLDGIVDLEAKAVGDKGDMSLRFSVESVDIHTATESDIQRQRSMVQSTQATDREGTTLPPITEVATAVGAERKLKTIGLQLIDQWRGSSAVKELSRSFGLPTGAARESDLVLDADDLTVGYRLDVAMRTGDGKPLSWACLTHRLVTYSWPGSASKLDQAVDEAIGATGSAARARRAELDGSVLTTPTRLLQNDDGNKTGFAETVLAMWPGDPLGLEARGGSVSVCSGGLALDLGFDLPSGPDDPRPARLRLGVPYWLGARVVFLGGVCLSLEDARLLYEKGLEGGMATPRKEEFRRFLRHEWIDPPMTAVPWPEIAAELETPGGRAPRGLDGQTMVVRSLPEAKPGDDAWRFGPTSARRAFCAPGVDFTFAHLHGVFDADAALTRRGGLMGVDYDPSRGGFPSFAPQELVAEASIAYTRQTATPDGFASGISVFRARSQPFGTGPVRPEDLYFPDPAARSLVVALRYAWTPATYLAGTPIVVPLYGGGNSGFPPRAYPDAVPLLVSVNAIPHGPDGRLTSYDQLEQRAGKHIKRMVPIRADRKASGDNAAIEVSINLAPGEDFEIDVWAVPDLDQLAQWFDAPESLAFFAAPSAADCQLDYNDEWARLAWALPGGVAGKAKTSPNRIMRRNDAVISSAAVAAAARALHATMLLRPIAELASVRSVRAVHAALRPSLLPVLGGLTGRLAAPHEMPHPGATPLPPPASPPRQAEIRFLRVDNALRNRILGDPDEPLRNWHAWSRTGDSATATDILVGGDLFIERALHESVELRVVCVAPTGRPIDNPLLGRTAEDRSRGIWPQEPTAQDVVDDPRKATQRLYGFIVDEDGKVSFPAEEVVFSRWALALAGAGAAETVSLVALTAESESISLELGPDGMLVPRNSGDGRRSAQRCFSDGTARRIEAYVAATSRTARLVPERVVYPAVGEQKEDRRRLFAFQSNPKDAAQPLTTSTVIRSIVRPLALPRRHILPAFAWSHDIGKVTDKRTVNRRTRIRIPFDRPGVTSGEEERVGIVLWPPNILGASTKPASGGRPPWTDAGLANGLVRRAEPLPVGGNPSLIDMQSLNLDDSTQKAVVPWRDLPFSDEDLGPGGFYVTRWGADPINAAGETSWFLHPRAFLDVADWNATALESISTEAEDSGLLWPLKDRHVPRLVENVLMPIPGSQKEGDEGAAPAEAVPPAAGSDAMLVSLLTYAPRFDVETEQWYVDFEIDPGTAPDPFLRLGLVRFQPHSNRHLQVSYPIAAWIQVVGYRRDVTLTRGEGSVTVTVRSPVVIATDLESPATIMRATLLEKHRTEAGLSYERPAKTVLDDETLGDVIQSVAYADPQSNDLMFSAELPLPAVSEDDNAVSYAVFIEEVYRMRRASLDQEPVGTETSSTERDDPSFWRDTGPRFAIRLDL